MLRRFALASNRLPLTWVFVTMVLGTSITRACDPPGSAWARHGARHVRSMVYPTRGPVRYPAPTYSHPVATYPVAPTPASVATVRTPAAPPVPAVSQAEADQATKIQEARPLVADAKKLFAAGQFDAAAAQLDRVVELLPEDADARQFRSLILFAQGRYQAAAADAYDAIQLAPTWDWKTVRSLYADASAYTEQLRQLETAVRQSPTSVENHFLLAYHYLMMGHWRVGEQQLAKVLELQPNEEVSTKLMLAARQRQDLGVAVNQASGE